MTARLVPLHDKDVGNSLRLLREERCLSLEQAAEQLGMATEMVDSIESGSPGAITLDTLHDYASTFNLDITLVIAPLPV